MSLLLLFFPDVCEVLFRRLTHEDDEPVPGSHAPAVQRHLLVRGHVRSVVLLALFTLVHGLVGLLFSATEAEAPPEASCGRGNNNTCVSQFRKSLEQG